MRINASRGQTINFAANNVPASGVIVGVEQTPGPWASIAVLTADPIPKAAQLSIPSLPEQGGCGQAYPVAQSNGRVTVILSVGHMYIDGATIGK